MEGIWGDWGRVGGGVGDDGDDGDDDDDDDDDDDAVVVAPLLLRVPRPPSTPPVLLEVVVALISSDNEIKDCGGWVGSGGGSGNLFTREGSLLTISA